MSSSSSNYTILRLSSQSQAKSSQSLKIPIKTKTVIRMTPEQIKEICAVASTTQLRLSTSASLTTSPRIVGKACGPFNAIDGPFESSKSNWRDICLTSSCFFDPNDFIYNYVIEEEDAELENMIMITNNNNNDNNNNNNNSPTSEIDSQNFEMKNIENINLADIVAAEQQQQQQQLQSNSEEMMELLMTPTMEKEIFGFLRSQSASSNHHEPPTAAIISESELSGFFMQNDGVPTNDVVFDLEQQLQASSTSRNLQLLFSAIDHEYTSKRRQSDDSFYSADDSSSYYPPSATSSSQSQSQSKRRRVKGIYRQSDITNEEERRNYLERRKKNNVSSKNSRANKKNYYSSLDGKCSELSKENDMLEHKISILEYVNKYMKEHLIQRVSGK